MCGCNQTMMRCRREFGSFRRPAVGNASGPGIRCQANLDRCFLLRQTCTFAVVKERRYVAGPCILYSHVHWVKNRDAASAVPDVRQTASSKTFPSSNHCNLYRDLYLLTHSACGLLRLVCPLIGALLRLLSSFLSSLLGLLAGARRRPLRLLPTTHHSTTQSARHVVASLAHTRTYSISASLSTTKGG